MAIVRKKAKREQLILDTGVSTEWDAYVHTHGASGRNFPERFGFAGIELRGQLAAGIGGITAFEFRLSRKREAEVKSASGVGSVMAVKPEIRCAVDLTEEEFAVALALVASGRPVHLHWTYERPRWGSSTIRSFAMSGKPIE